MRSFFMHRCGVCDFICAVGTQRQSVRKESSSSKLHALAKMRIEQSLVSAHAATSEGLPLDVVSGIERILTGSHKTFRYMLFTGLLAAVSDKTLHPRCLQAKAKVDGAYDARSLCQKVVVPFEKKMLQGRLGASNEPFANKSARYPMIEKENDVRSGPDRQTLFCLYDVLEFVKASNELARRSIFEYALSVIMKLPPSKSTLTSLPVTGAGDIGAAAFFDFFESHTKGVSAVATLAAAFRLLYWKPAKIKAHPATESGASSKEVGDIDVELPDGLRIAVEVKDKPYRDVDVDHACEKALKSGVGKVIFAVGASAEKVYVHEGALMDFWAEKGVELSFLRISNLLGTATAIGRPADRRRMAADIGRTLDEMNASGDVKELFSRTFKKEVL